MKNLIRCSLVAMMTVALAMTTLTPVQAGRYSTPTRILNALPVQAEVNGGYSRAKFPHWRDLDRDCQDTREEVLIAESRVRVGGCTFTYGKWLSRYDGKWYRKKANVDIDHHVALAEAWGSGARRWSPTRRMLFANDLFGPSLNVMTPYMNRYKKNAYDPGQWLPPRYRCRYAIDWVKVKYRWKLSVDSREKAALRALFAGSCGSMRVTLPSRR